MAITVNNSGGKKGVAVSTSTLSFTVDVGSEILVVSVMSKPGSPPSSVKYNNVNLTKAIGAANATGNVYSSIWYLLSPATGANNLVVDLGTSGYLLYGAVSLSGINTVSPIGNTGSTTGTNDSMTINATSTNADNMIIDAMAVVTTNDNTNMTEGANQTEIFSDGRIDFSSNLAGGASYEVGSGTITMSWTGPNTNYFVTTTVEIKTPSSANTSAFFQLF